MNGALKVRGETIGELAVDQAEGLDDQAAELVMAVAERLSAHIENLRLLEETQHRRFELEERSQELEASQRVTFAANETDDPDELLDLVVNLIRDQFDLYHAQVYVVDAEKQAAVLRKSTGYAGRQLLEQGHAIRLDQAGPLARALGEGQPAVIADVAEDKSWQPDPLLPHTRSELVIPLKAGQEVIGALDVHSRTPNRFTPRTVALFSAMAEQVAMNFESADLLIRTTQQAEALTSFATQLRTAAEVSERLSAILDPQQLLSEVVDLLQSRFGLYHAHIYLLETPPASPPQAGGTGGGRSWSCALARARWARCCVNAATTSPWRPRRAWWRAPLAAGRWCWSTTPASNRTLCPTRCCPRRVPRSLCRWWPATKC